MSYTSVPGRSRGVVESGDARERPVVICWWIVAQGF